MVVLLYYVKVIWVRTGPLLLAYFSRISFVLCCGNKISETASVVKGGFLFLTKLVVFVKRKTV